MKPVLSLLSLIMFFAACNANADLPRADASEEFKDSLASYFGAVEAASQDLHSIMVVRGGKVIAEKWFGENGPDTPHILNSVSKTFTSTAVGIAVDEGLLSVDDKVLSFFPDKAPENPDGNLSSMTVKDLLTMSCGHSLNRTSELRSVADADWVEEFLSTPVDHVPGTYFCYNSMGTYMLSAIIQKVSGEKLADYLYPRLFEPLGIEKPYWEESPQGVNCGGWGLYLKTEDMAKLGQLYLRKGEWNGRSIVSSGWVEAASSAQIYSVPAGLDKEGAIAAGLNAENSDWVQGYGYQMWRCRHNAYRADGADGQYIIVIPDKDAVIAVTADIGNMQAEINLIWDHLLPAL